ncbi:DUF4156 domain-containing protein [Utexia brackfieldae]|uniref:DUF4156 domain-containing protein n=1 Tax=Utexia brackfieldae TaxID=3074108 RepID=UPI00370D970F
MSLKKCLLIASAAMVLTACGTSGTQLTTAGEAVKFVDVKPGSDCQLLGKTEGRRSSFFAGTKTHSELIREAAKDLQNRAGAMGGNVIFNAQDATMQIVSELVPTDAVMAGEVYKCP